MIADAEQDDKAWKKARRSGGIIGHDIEFDKDTEVGAEQDGEHFLQHQLHRSSDPEPASAALTNVDEAPLVERSVSSAEDAPLLPTLTPSARGAAAIARAAERQRSDAVSETTLQPAAAAEEVVVSIGSISEEQRAAETVIAKKLARKRAKQQKKRAADTRSTDAEHPEPPLRAETPPVVLDNNASAPLPPSGPPPNTAAQQVCAGFEDTNWGTVDVGLLPENWTAHRDPTSHSFYYFNERIHSGSYLNVHRRRNGFLWIPSLAT